MQVQQGVVRYKDRSDIVCTYGITDDGKQYYFMDDRPLTNGNLIVTSALVEAIDPLIKASHVGVIDNNGGVVIPLENKAVKSVNNNLLLVEKAVPTTPSVLEAIKLKNDPLAAAKLVTTPATIKEKISSKMRAEGRFVFNDQFSEATIYDLKGNNLVNNDYYSFIGVTSDKIYFSKNTADSEVMEYSLFPTEVVNREVPKEQEIKIENVAVKQGEIEKAITKEMATQEQEVNTSSPNVAEVVPAPAVSVNNPVNDVVSQGVNAVEEQAKAVETVANSSMFEPPQEEVANNDVVIKPEEKKEEVVENAIVNDQQPVVTDNNMNGVEEHFSEEVMSTKPEGEIVPEEPISSNDLISQYNTENNIESNDDVEKGENAISDAIDDDNETMFTINFDVDDEQEKEADAAKIFGDSLLSDDKIVNINADMNELDNDEEVVLNVTKAVASLIDLNRKQQEKIKRYEEQGKDEEANIKVTELNDKIKNYEETIQKLEDENRDLKSKVDEQQRELEALRPQVKSREELLKILADAHNLLSTEDQKQMDEKYYSRRAA